MNSNIFVFRKLAIFFTILVFFRMESAAMDSTSTSETEKYEPLYVIDELLGFSLANFMIFDEKSQKRIFMSREGDLIGPACPKKYENPDGVTVKMVGAAIADSITWRPLCDNPVKFLVVKNRDGDQYSVGFVFYQIGIGHSHLPFNENIPKDHIFISFLVFQFQKEGLRTVHVWHNIDFGKSIQIESEEPINNEEYEKNLDIFELDIDEAYSPEQQEKIFFSKHEVELPCPLVKIQLVPAEDLLLQNYKMATRINLNTTPIWEKILPQWRSLETFIRKVARILGRLRIATGTYKTIQWSYPGSTLGKEDILLHSLEKLAIPRFLWKAAMTNNGKMNDSDRNFGIIFIMHNHPNSRSRNMPPLCQDIISETGWNLHTQHQQQSDVELTSQIYACKLNQDIMNLVGGGTLSIPEYKVFNLRNVLKSYEDDEFNSEEFEEIDVIEELHNEKLLP